MKIKLTIILLTAFVILAISGCYYRNEQDLYQESNTCNDSNVTYSATIAPIFEAYCNSCHYPNNPNSDVVTDNYASDTIFHKRITGAINWESNYVKMPKDAGAKIPTCDLLKIDTWIRQGMQHN
jgi:hypothetical protein